MAHQKLNGVRQIVTGTGTGALTFGAATSGKFQTLANAGLANGDTTYVRIQHSTIDAEWELVKATRSSSTITRTFDGMSESATGSLISFSSGDKIVSSAILAGEVVTQDASGNVNISGTLTAAGFGESPPDFATALQAAVNASEFLDWPYGDVTLSSALTITVPNGTSNIGFDMHGAELLCGFNASTSDLIKFAVATGTNDFAYLIRVRNTNFNGAGSSSFNGSTNQCRNGLVFQALTGNASMFSITVSGCTFNPFPNGSGLLFYGGIFESHIIDCAAQNCGMGFELRQQDLSGGGQVLSSVYVIGGCTRLCGFDTPTQGNDMGGISSTSVQPYSGAHSVAFKNHTFVNHRGPGLWLSCGSLQVDSCHFEACCRDSAGSRGAIYCFYGGVTIQDCDGANPDSGTTAAQNYLVEFSSNMDTSRDHSYIRGSYNVVEGSGTVARLGHLLGTSTIYVDGWSYGSTAMWTGAGTWTVRTTNYTNTTV